MIRRAGPQIQPTERALIEQERSRQRLAAEHERLMAVRFETASEEWERLRKKRGRPPKRRIPTKPKENTTMDTAKPKENTTMDTPPATSRSKLSKRRRAERSELQKKYRAERAALRDRQRLETAAVPAKKVVGQGTPVVVNGVVYPSKKAAHKAFLAAMQPATESESAGLSKPDDTARAVLPSPDAAMP